MNISEDRRAIKLKVASHPAQMLALKYNASKLVIEASEHAGGLPYDNGKLWIDGIEVDLPDVFGEGKLVINFRLTEVDPEVDDENEN